MPLLPFGSPPGISRGDADDRYVNIDGDTMEGDLVFPVDGYIMTDSGGQQWRVTIDTSGAIVTTAITGGGTPGAGYMIATGPMYGITYAS